MAKTATILHAFSMVCFAGGFCIAFILLIEYFTTEFKQIPQSFNASKIHFEREYMLRYNALSIDRVVESLPGYRDTVNNCSSLTGERPNFGVYNKAVRWNFNATEYREKLFQNVTNKCATIRNRFSFFNEPLSKEEEEYPLAYGFLVYDNAIQIYFLLSAIYQPQNAYCIAVDSKSSDAFKEDMDLIGDCFPNIYVIQVHDVQWYKFSVVRGVWTCIRYLANVKRPWKYYQYLSGVDLPLKTNLEMVRIFKQLNGTTNIDVKPIPADRIKQVKDEKWPLQLYKSSLSGLLSREGVDAMMESERVRNFIIFSQKLECPDEALWATIFGNSDTFSIPSNFDGKSVLEKVTREDKEMNEKNRCSSRERLMVTKEATTLEEPFVLYDYYISRYQVWIWPYTQNAHPFCHGKFTHFSCVYGLLDVRNLITRPELVGHKFYLDVQPAAYFCLYETVRRRALNADGQRRFRGDAYARLPHVRMAAGEAASALTFRTNKCKLDP